MKSPRSGKEPRRVVRTRLARRRMEHDALMLRLGQLRGILETASEGIITADGSQTIVMANRAAAEIFRCRVEDLVGAPLATLLPERLRTQHRADVAAFGAEESAARRMGRRENLVGLRADGEEFPLEAGISQVHVDGKRLYTVILRDLGEAQRIAAALYSSEQLFAATFSHSSVAMAHIDPANRRFLAVNAAMCALTGYESAELLQMGPDRLNHPEEPVDPSKFAALLDGTADYRVEKRLVRKDGSVVWVEVSGSVVRTPDGRPVRVVGLLQDISLRRAAEAALREREARQSFLVRLNDRLRSLDDPLAIAREASCLLGEFVDAARVGYAEDDGNGETITLRHGFNRGVPGIEGRYRYTDYGDHLLLAFRVGRTVVRPDIAGDPTLSPAEKAAHARLQLAATVNVPVRKGGQLQAVFFVHAATPRAWLPEEVALFEDVAERIRADIERARAEAEVRATKTKLEAALESIADAVFISDAQGNFLEFNSAFAGFHGFASKAVCPRRQAEYPALFDVCLADGSPAPLDQWAVSRALRGEVGRSVEYGLRRKDTGEYLTGSYSYAPIRDEQGQIVGAVITARDISDMKRLQAQLQASHAELQQLIDAQDRVQEAERLRIARELHDDLQQGLAAILMEAAAVGQYLGDDDSPARRALAGIKHLGEQLIASTRRIVSDLRPQILEDLGLAAAIENLASQFTQRSGISCEVDSAELRPADEACAAPTWACLYRVAQEALNNVGKHAGAGRVRIRLASMVGQSLQLSIGDDGMGIPADRRRSATSFGLLGMRERVRAAGGRLLIRSEPGQGTTIEVELPLPPCPASLSLGSRSRRGRG
ncbi:PAS domain S-box protein [Sphaerotilus microaerophilus]|uniref:PAS domain S-box protein n=1 Tax=Sphaerotilus microaerophilus TaxID=2914710 RepID=UPI002072D54E|nr:PAS domain S-box protein [Sphaerotilus sp. FB-5]